MAVNELVLVLSEDTRTKEKVITEIENFLTIHHATYPPDVVLLGPEVGALLSGIRSLGPPFYCPTMVADIAPWSVQTIWTNHQNDMVMDLRMEIERLRAHIAGKTKVWDEAERIKGVHDGETVLKIDAIVPARVCSLQVLNSEELSDGAISAVLAKVRNQSRNISVSLRVQTPSVRHGYNHAFMEAIYRLSSEFRHVLTERVEAMVKKLMTEDDERMELVDPKKLEKE